MTQPSFFTRFLLFLLQKRPDVAYINLVLHEEMELNYKENL